MSFLNKFKDFTEYHDMVSSAKTLQDIDKTIIDSNCGAFGNNYDLFLSKQKEDLKVPFSQVGEKCKRRIDAMAYLHNELAPFPTDMGQFLSQLEDLKRMFKLSNDQKNKFKKESDTLEKNRAYLKEAQNKGDQKAIAKYEAAVRSQENVVDREKTRSDELNNQYQKLSDELKVRIPSELSQMISAFCEKRRKITSNYAQIGADILEITKGFHNYEDELIQPLKDRLAKWETEEI